MDNPPKSSAAFREWPYVVSLVIASTLSWPAFLYWLHLMSRDFLSPSETKDAMVLLFSTTGLAAEVIGIIYFVRRRSDHIQPSLAVLVIALGMMINAPLALFTGPAIIETAIQSLH